MADDAHRQIDRAFDVAERVVDSLGGILGVDTRSGIDGNARHRGVANAKNANPVLPEAKTQKALPASTHPADAFRIIEIPGIRGRSTWNVTNGVENAVCSTRAIAEQVLAAIGKATS